MTFFQMIFVPFCGAMALLMAARTLRRRVGRRQGLLWILIWSAAAILILSPSTTTLIAAWLGIGRGADLVLYLTTLTGLAAGIHFYAQQRRLDVLVTELMRRNALADARQGPHPPSTLRLPFDDNAASHG